MWYCAAGTVRWDVFLSHAGENKPFAEDLCERLGQMGLRAFVDKVALKPGWYMVFGMHLEGDVPCVGKEV